MQTPYSESETAAPATGADAAGGARTAGSLGSIGYSPRIRDPAFANYQGSSGRGSAVFSLILAIMAIIGFYLAGEWSSSDMRNPQSLYIGLSIGGMFLLIAVAQVSSRRDASTWDGQVVDKRVECRRRQQRGGDGWEDYQLYTILLRDDQGRLHRIRLENDATIYDYYAVGDRLRHHGGLNSYEKYDKSKDSIVFCNACGTMHSITAEYCQRCRCPLLK